MVKEAKKTDKLIENLWDIIEVLSSEFNETRKIVEEKTGYSGNSEYYKYRGFLNCYQQRGVIKIILLLIQILDCREIAEIIEKEKDLGNINV